MTLTLLPLMPAQAEVLAALHSTGFKEPWPIEAFTSLLADPIRLGALALDDGAPVGFVLLQQTRDEAEVLTLVVAPPARRRGAGRALMQWAISTCAAEGQRRLVLEVAESNTGARALYNEFGFAEIGQRTGYYRGSRGAETALLLERAVVTPTVSR